MAKRNRGGSLTDLLAEATGGTGESASTPEPERDAPEAQGVAMAESRARRGRGEARTARAEDGHVRQSDGSYVRADGARRVSLQLKMDPDDKRALKVQAAAAGLSPAEYVARLVREDGQR